MSTVTHIFTKPAGATSSSKELPYWVAATTHNSVVEYRQYATDFGIGQPPTNLKILVTNWGAMQSAGAAPMWNKCSSQSSNFSDFKEYIEFFIAKSTFSFQANLFGILKNQMDVIVGYLPSLDDYNCRLNSPDIKTIVYHELGHASHFAQATCDYWQVYRTRIANELATSFGSDPYGDGTETNAGVVAVGEMWGNHIQYLFTNQRYGNGGGNSFFRARSQGSDWTNEAGGLNAYLRAIENFNPNLTGDGHRWIPQGLPYDLMDGTGEIFPVQDNVNNYNTQQSFNALQPDVRTVLGFRNRLLLQNANTQQLEINNLFNAYNY